MIQMRKHQRPALTPYLFLAGKEWGTSACGTFFRWARRKLSGTDTLAILLQADEARLDDLGLVPADVRKLWNSRHF